MDAAATCAALLALHQPSPHVSTEEARATCERVYRAAARHGEDPTETAAQAGIESRWNDGAVSPRGCRGAMQVQPIYVPAFCATLGLDSCGDVVAGMGARKRWRASLRRRGLPSAPLDVLCAYAHGMSYRGGGCGYGQRVLVLARRAARSPPGDEEEVCVDAQDCGS